MDRVVELYDADRTLLTYDDDGGDEILASRLRWAATEGGRLYVMIEHWSGSSAGPSTTYDVSLSLGEAFRIDAYEPDDSRSEASEMAVGGTQTHNLHVEGDQDWLCFQAVAGTTYIIETFNLGDNMDTVIHFCDEEGNELASDDDGDDELWASGLVWTTTEDGSLYIMVEHWGYGVAGPGTDYDISVSRV